MELKSLMLWKNDFAEERNWHTVCRALNLPEDTVEIEMKCLVSVAKSHYTHPQKAQAEHLAKYIALNCRSCPIDENVNVPGCTCWNSERCPDCLLENIQHVKLAD